MIFDIAWHINKKTNKFRCLDNRQAQGFDDYVKIDRLIKRPHTQMT